MVISKEKKKRKKKTETPTSMPTHTSPNGVNIINKY